MLFSFFIYLCFVLCGIFLFKNYEKILSYKRMVFHNYAKEKLFPEFYINQMSKSARKSIQLHIDLALKNLKKNEEKEIAAALNDYLFQYLVMGANTANVDEILRQGHAICGGHAQCLCTMLALCDISARLAYLQGVPMHSTHQMVQVQFSDGKQGLYDPCFGRYWENAAGDPLSIEHLIADPSLASYGARQTRHAKRKRKTESIAPFYSIEDHYCCLKEEGSEKIHCQLFADLGGGGICDGSGLDFITIPLSPSHDSFGTDNRKNALISARSPQGDYLSWAHFIGTEPMSCLFSAHIYEISELQPHQPYALELSYTESFDTTLSLKMLGGTIFDYKSSRVTAHLPVDTCYSRTSRKLVIPFQPERSVAYLMVQNHRGYLRLCKIKLLCLSTLNLSNGSVV